MSRPATPDPAKLVVGVFMADTGLFEPVARRLFERFGPMDLMSPWLSFHHTSYYEPEMGGPLFRRMMAFGQLIRAEDLVEIKAFTNALEDDFTQDGRRRVNVDPGYLVLERFVLATGKNFTHRIYLGQSVFADLTLIYHKGDFQTLPWTYPDYAGQEIRSFLHLVRKKYCTVVRPSRAKA